ncbi:collagen-like protein [Streptomyces sp. NBC_01707]|uniref:hypothetical protein n=1 Tax=Streptomyces sp. NBC_01707 TaxID=2975914 RepID=UPI00352C93B2
MSGTDGSVGTQGPVGPAGPQGLAGPAGSPGEPGAQGEPGESGAQGAPGTPGVPGSPGTQGEPGPAGAQGIPGTPGAPGAPGTQIARAVATTDSSGQAVFTWFPAFAAPPIVTLAVQAGAGFRSVRIVSNTATTTTIQATGAAVVELLGIQLLAASIAAAGVVIHATAVPA